MKANELRIGNYVYLEDMLQEIKFYDFICLDNKDYTEEDYNPIPLTEDWLLKLGFENSFKFISKSGYLFECGLDGDDFVNNQRTLLINKSLIVKIKHVHQLQNIYHSLCQEELTIKEVVK